MVLSAWKTLPHWRGKNYGRAFRGNFGEEERGKKRQGEKKEEETNVDVVISGKFFLYPFYRIFDILRMVDCGESLFNDSPYRL